MVDEGGEAGVAVGGALVEGVLADHVGGGEEEQLRLGVGHEGQATLVGEGAPARGADGRGEVGPQGAAAGARELGHGVLLWGCR